MQKHEMLFRRYVRWCCIAVTSLALIKYVQQHIPATTAPTMIAGDANGSAVVNFSGHAPTANRIVADPVRSTERTVVKEDTIIPQGKDESGRLWRFWNEVESGAATPDVPAVTVEEPAATPVEAPATPSLQPWEWWVIPDEKNALEQQAARLQNAVFLVGSPNGGGKRGTAFCISRKHRLLATAGHITDGHSSIQAVMGGTNRVYRASQWWRSATADVAVIQLEANAWLPAEFTLARAKHAEHLPRRAVATLGFPGYAWYHWPGREESVSPNTSFGVLYEMGSDGTFHYNAAIWYGSSGCPIFTEDGLVVGIPTGFGFSFSASGLIHVLNKGTLTDAIWDVLNTGAGLTGLLSSDTDGACPNHTPAPERSWQTKPQLPLEAQERLTEGWKLINERRYTEAIQNLNKMESLTPWAWELYDARAYAYIAYKETLNPRQATRRQYAFWAWQQAVCALNLNATDPNRYIAVGHTMLHLHRNDAAHSVRSFAEKMIQYDKDFVSPELLADYYCLHALALRQLRQPNAALVSINEAVRLQPEDSEFYSTRALIYDESGRSDLARQDRKTMANLGMASR